MTKPQPGPLRPFPNPCSPRRKVFADQEGEAPVDKAGATIFSVVFLSGPQAFDSRFVGNFSPARSLGPRV